MRLNTLTYLFALGMTERLMWEAHRTWDSVGRAIVQDKLSVSHQSKKLLSQPTVQTVLTLRKSRIKLRQALDSTFMAKR